MIERFSMDFEPGGDARVVSVHLPEDYGERAPRCPVMYMFDGQHAFEPTSDDYDGTWRLHRFLLGWEKDMIVVAVESSAECDRHLAEYCPYPLDAARFRGLKAQGERTLGWLTDRLKPEIDARYRTLPERACTGVMGGCLGALMSLAAVTLRNDVFSKAACVSPALGTCLPDAVRGIEARALDADTRVYISLGAEEARDKQDLTRAVSDTLTLANALTRSGARVYPYLQERGRHCEADWSLQAPEFMRFLWLE